jgi:hypothetical protein
MKTEALQSISQETLMPVESTQGNTNTSFILKVKSTLVDDNPINAKNSKPIIAIMAASRSKKTWRNATNTDLFRILLPSIAQTVSEYDVAIDDDDQFYTYNNPQISIWLDLLIPSFLTVHVHSFPKTMANRIPFNELAQAAYADGAEYFCRTNDDSEFISTDWITKAVNVLAEKYDPPNLGVVGPTSVLAGRNTLVNTQILTHDFCHRTHLQIFEGRYYPEEIKNWCLDDWITNMYLKEALGVDRMTKLADWTVMHHASKPRYNPRRVSHQDLQQLYVEGLAQVRRFVNKSDPSKLRLFQVQL